MADNQSQAAVFAATRAVENPQQRVLPNAKKAKVDLCGDTIEQPPQKRRKDLSTGMGNFQCCSNDRNNSKAEGVWGLLNRAPTPLKAPNGGLTVATWNIAAINNNPFEYWITHNDPLYAQLMDGVESFIDSPGDRDVEVQSVFTQDMFNQLKADMEAEGWTGVDTVEKYWREDYSKRKLVSGFLKDKAIGSKRLASMPDRLTNTINVVGGGAPVCRPTVINNYVELLDSVDAWWVQWREFMFKKKLEMEVKGKAKTQRPCEMLSKISRAKYPAVTEEEEEVSIALQCLCQAIFDAIMVHMMVTLSPDGRWQSIKVSIVEAMFSKKNANTIKILRGACAQIDIICLQECAASFKAVLEQELGSQYYIMVPADADPNRDQNSIVLLSKSKFLNANKEVTADAIAELAGSPVERGDLIVVSAQTALGENYLVGSFHGDTNGLATKPVVSAVSKLLAQQPAGCRVIFGLDANTHLKPKEGLQDVADFLGHCKTLGLRTCFPDGTDMAECCTTCNARTFVQPQLNKAIRNADKLTKGGIDPNDHILFQSDIFETVAYYKDNTGDRTYTENVCFPTLQFPSDHGIVSAVLKPVEVQAPPPKEKAVAVITKPPPPPLEAPEGGLTIATWNIAAINNNPFEYWITHDDKLYEELMMGVEGFIDQPGDKDVPVHEVFTDVCFAELKDCMVAEGWKGVDVVEKFWQEDYRNRKIVSGFMKDKSIGSKRLASMPDRLTNTISVAGGGPPVCRPTVVNNFVGPLGSIKEWWPQWRDFMFKNTLTLAGKGTTQRPCEMLSKISKAKYPAVTDEEEAVSIPLQCLCQAIFDAVLVHIMVTLSPDGRWQNIKESIVEAIFSKKNANTLRIMSGTLAETDIILLQESAATFKEVLDKEMGDKYHVFAPADCDPKRDQNSMVLLSKAKFSGAEEVTAAALKELGSGAPVERGDLIAVTAKSVAGENLLVASFHGDTNGLATKPVVSAVSQLLASQPASTRVIFGMDANTYLKPKEGFQDVADFLAHCESLKLRTCFPDGTDMAECCTCCNARTYVQTQLNKAVKSSDKLVKGDLNPKDHILFQSAAYEVLACHKDNTGDREYKENLCFPTLRFPSDHGIVSIVLKKLPAPAEPAPAEPAPAAIAPAEPAPAATAPAEPSPTNAAEADAATELPKEAPKEEAAAAPAKDSKKSKGGRGGRGYK